jgi:octaprenyl-diphosphate synthase
MSRPSAATTSTRAARQSSSDFVQALREELAADLDAVEREIEEVLAAETNLTREVGRYARNTRGKQLRPILLVLAAKACGAEGRAVHQTAASLEIVHNASLLHDDVIDKSLTRRGKPTVNAQFGDNVAILMADYLYSNAFKLALQCLNPEVLMFITRVTSNMCEGEMFQIEKAGELLTESDYERIVKGKTAYLFSACCGLGAVLADAGERKLEALSRFGLAFGMAFQITDDVLDYVAEDDHFGKTVGTDIGGGKQTLPLIHALASAENGQRERMLASLGSPERVGELIAMVRDAGGIDYALTRARHHALEGRALLDDAGFAPTPALERLRELADFIVARTY